MKENRRKRGGKQSICPAEVDGGTTHTTHPDLASAGPREKRLKFSGQKRKPGRAKSAKPDPREWAVPTVGASDWEVKAWAIWEYSRELYTREPFAALCAEKIDREKTDAVFDISYAVFGTSAPLILNGRVDTPWKGLDPIERKRMIGLLIAGAEAFTASVEREAPCSFEDGNPRRSYQTPFVNLPRGTDVIRGRFAIDRAKGTERIMQEFRAWLEKECKVKSRGRGRVDEPRAWLRQLACFRYVTARGSSDVETIGERNRMIRDQSAPVQTFSQLKTNAGKAKKILAANEALALRVLHDRVNQMT